MVIVHQSDLSRAGSPQNALSQDVGHPPFWPSAPLKISTAHTVTTATLLNPESASPAVTRPLRARETSTRSATRSTRTRSEAKRTMASNRMERTMDNNRSSFHETGAPSALDGVQMCWL